MAYWYDIEQGKVIESDKSIFHGKLMGPYDTEQEAQHALETAAERTKKWDEEDADWNGG